MCFFFSSRRRHTRYIGDWSSDVCSSDLELNQRRDVHRKEAPREAIDEAATGDGRAVHDVEVLPAERDRARPLEIGRASCRERVEISVGGGCSKGSGDRFDAIGVDVLSIA